MHDSFVGIDEVFTEALRTSPVSKSSKRNGTLQIKAELHLITALMSLFFEIAIACSPRTTPKSRKEGDLFLRRLFSEFQHCLETRVGPKSSESLPKSYARSLRILLEQAVKYDVCLDMATIESILEQASGLYNNSGTQRVEWQLVALCLKNNADVFVIPTGASSGLYSYRKPNRTLENLLALLNTSSDSLSSKSGQLYSLKINGILIPLLHAFASARDLPAFLEHWKKQLDDYQKACKPLSSSLAEPVHQIFWDDDDFLFAAQEMIEPCLPVDHISSILEKIESNLRAWALSDGETLNNSDLVTLDCVLGGCHSEELQARLFERARSVYEALAAALLSASPIYGSQGWRLWRVFANINWKWVRYKSEFSTADILWQVAETAFTTLDVPGSETGADDTHSFQEQSFAFCSMTSLGLSDHEWNGTNTSFGKLFNKSVERVLSLKGLFCQLLSEDNFRGLRPLQNLQDWNGKAAGIKSSDELYLSCVAQLLTRPSVLRYLDATTQRHMLEQLSQLARHEGYLKDSSYAGVNYSWLWSCAQHCEAVSEQPAFATDIRRLQYGHFERLLRSQDPICWKVNSAEYTMALENLSDAPLLQFSSEHIIDIANKILDVVVRKKHLGLSSIARHLQLLVKFADAPKNSRGRMKIFQNIKMNGDALQERSAVFVLAEVVARETWSVERPACNDALCRLTHIIMRYVMCLLEYKVFGANSGRYVYATLELESSARYFTLFYQWIGGEMERANMNASMCPSGWTLDSPMLLVTWTALNYYYENRQKAMGILEPNNRTTDNIRRQHFERILQICNAGNFNWRLPSDRCRLAAILECLSGYMDLVITHLEFLQSECIQ